MTQKIDKLPLSIIYNGRKYKLAIVATEDIVRLTYRCGQPIYNAMLMNVEDIKQAITGIEVSNRYRISITIEAL